MREELTDIRAKREKGVCVKTVHRKWRSAGEMLSITSNENGTFNIYIYGFFVEDGWGPYGTKTNLTAEDAIAYAFNTP